MGGCISAEEIAPRNHLIVDVQQIIADDAWEEFVVTSRRRCRFRPLKRSDYTVEVPMNYYHFEETKQKFQQKERLPSLKQNDVVTSAAGRGIGDMASPDQVGLKTKFRNDTDKDQTYNFRFEKTRSATVQVTYQKGFSIGGSTSFSIGLPKVLPGGELSAEINTNYEVTSSKGQTFEESLTTEATSEIVVSRYNHCTANIVMEERRLLAQFTVWVTMSMPAGQAVVFIKNKQGRTVFLKVIENLSMLFPEENHIPIADSRDGGDVREDAVQFVIHGVVDGMQLANHYIHLKSRQIPGTEGAKGGGGGGGRKGKKGGGGEGNRGSLDDLSDMDMPKL